MNQVLPTMQQFSKANIGSILDLAMEADVDAATLSGDAAHQHALTVVKMLKESVDIASHQPESFVAVKITALVPPIVLQRWSNTLTLLKQLVNEMSSNDRISFEQFVTLSKAFPKLKGDTAKTLFSLADTDRDGFIDWIDLTEMFSIHRGKEAAIYLTRDDVADASVPVYKQLAAVEDIETAELTIKAVDELCSHANQGKVRIMMDAEQTYFQPAIDDVSLGFCHKWNLPIGVDTTDAIKNPHKLSGPLIFNTYQLYLKDGHNRLKQDHKRAQRLGYTFGVKIVRGAYMVSERLRAKKLGLPDPINETLQDTHKSYNTSIAYLIAQMPPRAPSKVLPVSFVVASHNKESVTVATDLMRQYKVQPRDGSVSFAQLMGMQDATAYGLASHGFSTYKYIPYGPIEVTIPYLQRRAQENSAVLGAVGEDKRNLIKELKVRFGLAKE